jgi:hypothetical protein
VRCGERACPFCGAEVTSFMRVLEYRIANRLDRSRIFSLGAALAAAGFVTNCARFDSVYGAPCNPPTCGPQAGSGGVAGEASDTGTGGGDTGPGGDVGGAGGAGGAN